MLLSALSDHFLRSNEFFYLLVWCYSSVWALASFTSPLHLSHIVCYSSASSYANHYQILFHFLLLYSFRFFLFCLVTNFSLKVHFGFRVFPIYARGLAILFLATRLILLYFSSPLSNQALNSTVSFTFLHRTNYFTLYLTFKSAEELFMSHRQHPRLWAVSKNGPYQIKFEFVSCIQNSTFKQLQATIVCSVTGLNTISNASLPIIYTVNFNSEMAEVFRFL